MNYEDKRGTSQREGEEILDKILEEAPQVWLEREIPPRQGTLPLIQVGFPQSTGFQQEAKSHNLEYTTGAS